MQMSYEIESLISTFGHSSCVLDIVQALNWADTGWILNWVAGGLA